MDSWADVIHPAHLLLELRGFLEQGGTVLVVIMITTFSLWLLIVERHYYFWSLHAKVAKTITDSWDQRQDKYSWYAQKELTELGKMIEKSRKKGL